MHTISRRLALLALGALTLFGTACGDDDDPAGPGSITGTYTLSTINGQGLPRTVYEGDDLGFYYKLEFMSGTLTLNSNGTFTDATTIRETEGDAAPETRTETTNGTYTRNGNTLTLTDVDTDDTYTLVVQNDGSLTQTEQFGNVQITARYVKQ